MLQKSSRHLSFVNNKQKRHELDVEMPIKKLNCINCWNSFLQGLVKAVKWNIMESKVEKIKERKYICETSASLAQGLNKEFKVPNLNNHKC